MYDVRLGVLSKFQCCLCGSARILHCGLLESVLFATNLDPSCSSEYVLPDDNTNPYFLPMVASRIYLHMKTFYQ
jgi:hypothetical protein